MASNVPVTLDTLIIIKVLYLGHNRKFKVPLRDLGPSVLPDRLRSLLQIHPDEDVTFERYSDSVGAYVILDTNNSQVYKTLFRAAKAKLKLRLRASHANMEEDTPAVPVIQPNVDPLPPSEGSSLHRMSSDTLAPRLPEQISPVIAHSPALPSSLSNHAGEEAKAAQASPVSPVLANSTDNGEALVPQLFMGRDKFYGGVRCPTESQMPELPLRPKPSSHNCMTSWVVFCNNCNQAMEDEHFHCSICDHGDYDLCQTCVDAGIHCPGAGHWMVKRFVKDGAVVTSVVERIGPKSKQVVEQEMPGTYTDEKQSVEPDQPTRTCNSCVNVLPENEFVTCVACDDYDLCLECHIANKHGHHPGHAFKAATPDTVLPTIADFLCNAGRNVRHSAVCDGCEKFIYGVRHKCLNCPDWDFCSECIKSAKFIHPRHRFVPIYEPLAEPASVAVRHYGIYCDGPLCKDKENPSYIEGTRYKCAVCHDTDFCANCEAIPSNRHNRTHPLIKFKTPVRSVSVTTMGEDKNGLPMARLGDQPNRRSTATETLPVFSPTNSATQVQTIVDVKPVEEQQSKRSKEKIEIRDLLLDPVPEKILSTATRSVEPVQSAPEPKAEPKQENFDAHFIRDTIPDGSKIGAGLNFVQVWTLRNPGPNPWPAGCSVRHVGGDNMLNIDNTRPLSHSELAEASESNVIGRPVESGEEISFRIMMKAPNREGTAISYWRLKTAEGTPFGHRLWCDIQVVGPTTPITIPTTTAPEMTSLRSGEPVEASSSSSRLPVVIEATRFSPDLQEQLRRKRQLLDAALRTELAPEKMAAQPKSPGSRDAHTFERERMLRIQKVREAAVKRVLESRRRESENLQANAAVNQDTSNIEKQDTAELPVPEKVVEAQGESSGMIFPQLEKESPASSTHEAAASTQLKSPEVRSRSTTIGASSVNSEEEFFEDAESVEIRSMSSDDEGFMTDEEYDILDASDEEIV
ncbi:hypothetical protein BU24DRAFT_415191 [Aaosphaeria arxii CBS 175.79]|uniref:ZZ-type domain-containing protein n=1 Tax=Aaosphaeria arxii CBS 175.79 TaxID=1450172 RepID=A0A6A5X8J0_9PLEO|nr:uncharacterized protein BU24DRAFT_415191 [Aaosphaeria arxii CBS 175.79]KAF2009268.1 hypothetical protein BU24DRAFT_415191 [Aaosphaeria arxii CBS 175.79]